MGRDDLYITVPSFFRCPISLDVMRSPVSLCTGVTYDRSSIQRWLDGGNNTCPATMQVLQTKDFVPNHTLHRLIRIWSESSRARPPDEDPTHPNPRPSSPPLSHDQARELIAQIQQNQNQNPNSFEFISKLISFVKDSDQNRKFLATIDEFVPLLVEIIISNSKENSVNYVAEIFILLESVLIEYRDRDYITKLILENRDLVVSSILLVLRQGSAASRIAAARVMEFITTDAESKLFFAEDGDILSELLRLVASPESDSDAIEAGLSALIVVSKSKRVTVRLVRLGSVKVLGRLLSDSNSSVGVIERVLKLLETVSSCKEGRAEMCEDGGVCVAAVVRRMLKVSAAATEHAVAVLWSLCFLFRDGAAQEAVARSNGVTKILLIMQSNCSPAVKQMAGELLKVFRVNSKSSCLSSYDTKTTHIMPF